MAEKKYQKLLSADVDSELVDLFLTQADERGYKKKRALAAATKLWVELPVEIQGQFINQSLNANSFLILVQGIVDERIEKGYADGKKFLAKRQKRKRPRKD
ncbi:hypothetical protein LCGC14_0403300 [marine sediment metagenome]|uniref:Uncharacterized protein n=1 Tax=marine sediment metagenome TaxID=412755 RepID=A0A0F9TE34_9ZZZZ